MLDKICGRLQNTKRPEVATVLLNAFECKFLARDFGELCDEIKIFNLLFRGGDSIDNIIAQC